MKKKKKKNLQYLIDSVIVCFDLHYTKKKKKKEPYSYQILIYFLYRNYPTKKK